MRSLILALICLLTGAALALIGMNALRQGTAYPNGVMAVMGAQMKALDGSIKQNRCAATDFLPRLQTMRYLGNDLEPAFLPTQDDQRFTDHASNLRSALDAALATPPSDCLSAGLMLNKVGKTCKGCHQDFKS